MDNKEIYVIIVTYNAMPWIDRCISSVESSVCPAKCIVVDNVSTDRTVEYIMKNFPRVLLFPQLKNLGFGGGNNFGIEYALNHGADFIYLLNQDAWIESDTIQILKKLMDENPMFGVISPLQTTKNKDALDRNFCHSVVNNREIGCSLFSDFSLNKTNDIYPCSFFQAAHWFMSRKCIEKVGLFSPVFTHYGEDNNYLYRVQYFGLMTGITAQTTGVHDRSERKNDNLASDAYFFTLQFLSKAANVNITGLRRAWAYLEYFVIYLIYMFFIHIYFVLFNEKRRYFLRMPNLSRVFNDVKKNRRPYFDSLS